MFIREHKVQDEDMAIRMSLLIALTQNEKDIIHIEQQMGPFLLKLTEGWECGDILVGQLLSLTSNMVKFNSAYFSQAVV